MGSVLLLAAAKPAGLLEALVVAVMALADPAMAGLSPPNPAVVMPLILSWLFLPGAGLAPSWDLGSSSAPMLAVVRGRQRASRQR